MWQKTLNIIFPFYILHFLLSIKALTWLISPPLFPPPQLSGYYDVTLVTGNNKKDTSCRRDISTIGSLLQPTTCLYWLAVLFHRKVSNPKKCIYFSSISTFQYYAIISSQESCKNHSATVTTVEGTYVVVQMTSKSTTLTDNPTATNIVATVRLRLTSTRILDTKGEDFFYLQDSV